MCLKQTFESKDNVKIARPTTKANLRLVSLDDSITSDDVAQMVTSVGNCETSDITIEEIGHRTPKSMGSFWVRCPVTAERKIGAAKRIMIQWCSARVEVLETRLLQCYRSLEPDHIKQQCNN